MQNLVQLSKVFSDQNRVNILVLVLRDKEVCVCEICDTLELLQPLVSRHLKQMKKENILKSTKKGKWVHYSLTDEPSSFLQCYINEIKNKNIKCASLVVCKSK